MFGDLMIVVGDSNVILHLKMILHKKKACGVRPELRSDQKTPFFWESTDCEISLLAGFISVVPLVGTAFSIEMFFCRAKN